MPKGGTRHNAGEKRKTPAAAAKRDPAVMPGDLSPDAQNRWERWAPSATRMGTLIAETAVGFRLLCETAVEADAMWAAITAEGLTMIKYTVDGSGQEHQEPKAHPLLGHWRALRLRVEQQMARFALAPAGQAVAVPGSEEQPDVDAHDFYGEGAAAPKMRRVK